MKADLKYFKHACQKCSSMLKIIAINENFMKNQMNSDKKLIFFLLCTVPIARSKMPVTLLVVVKQQLGAFVSGHLVCVVLP